MSIAPAAAVVVCATFPNGQSKHQQAYQKLVPMILVPPTAALGVRFEGELDFPAPMPVAFLL
jgi:hypothetical protein